MTRWLVVDVESEVWLLSIVELERDEQALGRFRRTEEPCQDDEEVEAWGWEVERSWEW